MPVVPPDRGRTSAARRGLNMCSAWPLWTSESCPWQRRWGDNSCRFSLTTTGRVLEQRHLHNALENTRNTHIFCPISLECWGFCAKRSHLSRACKYSESTSCLASLMMLRRYESDSTFESSAKQKRRKSRNWGYFAMYTRSYTSHPIAGCWGDLHTVPTVFGATWTPLSLLLLLICFICWGPESHRTRSDCKLVVVYYYYYPFHRIGSSGCGRLLGSYFSPLFSKLFSPVRRNMHIGGKIHDTGSLPSNDPVPGQPVGSIDNSSFLGVDFIVCG